MEQLSAEFGDYNLLRDKSKKRFVNRNFCQISKWSWAVIKGTIVVGGSIFFEASDQLRRVNFLWGIYRPQ